MAEAYEESFHKITTLDQLPPGKPAVFRAAGAILVLRRADDDSVEAIDGSCLSDDVSVKGEQRLRRIFECVAAGIGSPSSDWQSLVAKAGLPVKIEQNDVWVCVDACRQ